MKTSNKTSRSMRARSLKILERMILGLAAKMATLTWKKSKRLTWHLHLIKWLHSKIRHLLTTLYCNHVTTVETGLSSLKSQTNICKYGIEHWPCKDDTKSWRQVCFMHPKTQSNCLTMLFDDEMPGLISRMHLQFMPAWRGLLVFEIAQSSPVGIPSKLGC